MKRTAALLAAAVALASCDGNPFGGGDGGGGSISPLPGTDNPTSGGSIKRYEDRDDAGSGYVSGVRYNEADDTFYVDGLAFDGANTYQRGSAVDSLIPGSSRARFMVYDGPTFATDPETGALIPQFQHRAVYGVSNSGRVEFAIARTGNYVPYGFGGFVYQRNGGMGGALPTSGQALFSGDYAGIRDFDGAGGLEYVAGTMHIAIDFADFDDGRAVRGEVTDRRIYDLNGNDITPAILAELTAASGVTQTTMPVIRFNVGPGVMDDNGEMTGTAFSDYLTSAGTATVFETGNYYAVLSGDGTPGGDEIVGVIVLTADDPRIDGVTVRETGGFIVHRYP
jgi:hypothetical protein